MGSLRMSGALIVMLSLGSLWSGTAVAQHTGERVELTGSHAEAQFLSGEEVRVEARIEDDVFAAAGQVLFQGASADHVIAAGGTVHFTDSAAQDLILAGGKIDVEGRIADDLIAAGGVVRLGDGLRLDDSAWLAGRSLDVGGRIGGSLSAGARRITIRGDIAGDARLAAREIALAPGARIGGTLEYSSPEEIEIASGAVVAGEIRRVGDRGGAMPFSPPAWAGLAGLVVLVLGLAVLAAVAQAVLPGPIVGAEGQAVSRPWASLAVGFALLVAWPAAVILLFVTIVGLPLGLVLLALYAAALGLAFVSAAWWLGRWLARRFGRASAAPRYGERLLWTLVGLLALVLLAAIPLVGGWLVFLALLLGLGAAALHLWGRRELPAPAAAS